MTQECGHEFKGKSEDTANAKSTAKKKHRFIDRLQGRRWADIMSDDDLSVSFVLSRSNVVNEASKSRFGSRFKLRVPDLENSRSQIGSLFSRKVNRGLSKVAETSAVTSTIHESSSRVVSPAKLFSRFPNGFADVVPRLRNQTLRGGAPTFSSSTNFDEMTSNRIGEDTGSSFVAPTQIAEPFERRRERICPVSVLSKVPVTSATQINTVTAISKKSEMCIPPPILASSTTSCKPTTPRATDDDDRCRIIHVITPERKSFNIQPTKSPKPYNVSNSVKPYTPPSQASMRHLKAPFSVSATTVTIPTEDSRSNISKNRNAKRLVPVMISSDRYRSKPPHQNDTSGSTTAVVPTRSSVIISPSFSDDVCTEGDAHQRSSQIPQPVVPIQETGDVHYAADVPRIKRAKQATLQQLRSVKDLDGESKAYPTPAQGPQDKTEVGSVSPIKVALATDYVKPIKIVNNSVSSSTNSVVTMPNGGRPTSREIMSCIGPLQFGSYVTPIIDGIEEFIPGGSSPVMPRSPKTTSTLFATPQSSAVYSDGIVFKTPVLPEKSSEINSSCRNMTPAHYPSYPHVHQFDDPIEHQFPTPIPWQKVHSCWECSGFHQPTAVPAEPSLCSAQFSVPNLHTYGNYECVTTETAARRQIGLSPNESKTGASRLASTNIIGDARSNGCNDNFCSEKLDCVQQFSDAQNNVLEKLKKGIDEFPSLSWVVPNPADINFAEGRIANKGNTIQWTKPKKKKGKTYKDDKTQRFSFGLVAPSSVMPRRRIEYTSDAKPLPTETEGIADYNPIGDENRENRADHKFSQGIPIAPEKHSTHLNICHTNRRQTKQSRKEEICDLGKKGHPPQTSCGAAETMHRANLVDHQKSNSSFYSVPFGVTCSNTYTKPLNVNVQNLIGLYDNGGIHPVVHSTSGIFPQHPVVHSTSGIFPHTFLAPSLLPGAQSEPIHTSPIGWANPIAIPSGVFAVGQRTDLTTDYPQDKHGGVWTLRNLNKRDEPSGVNKAQCRIRQSKPKRVCILTESTMTSRQRQINIVRSSACYHNYVKVVPKESRTLTDPNTPNAANEISHRAFMDGVSIWKRELKKAVDKSNEKARSMITESKQPKPLTLDMMKRTGAPIEDRRATSKYQFVHGRPENDLNVLYTFAMDIAEGFGTSK